MNKSEKHDHRISNRMTRRAAVVGLLQLGFAGALALRMRNLQIEEAEQFRLLAEENRINVRLISPSRGEIYDRNGIILARNEPSYRITLIEEDAGDVERVLGKLAQLVPMSSEDLERTYAELDRNPSFLPVTVVDRVTWEDVSRVAINTPVLPGITPEVGLSRYYPLADNFTHVVGYVGPVSTRDLERHQNPDPLLKIPRFQIGKSRLEASFEDKLRGRAGTRQVEVNATGRIMRELRRSSGEAGENVQLTVDAALQCYVQARLGEESASAVVMDCKSGEILAMTSTPSYDPNKFVRGISHTDYNALLEDERKPLVSKALQGIYPPGSTFKMITAIAALESGLINEKTKVYCPGHLEISGKKKYCWKRGGHGQVNLEKSLRESCDVYYYEVALKVGIKKIAEVARRYGLGIEHDLGLEVEAAGLIPSKEWKKRTKGMDWLIGDTANASIGQGDVLTSPLQLAVMTARIATGKDIKPVLLNSNSNGGGQLPATDLEDDPARLKAVRQAMFNVSNKRNGTAYKSRLIKDKFRMAGKTGTSQVFSISEAERKKGITSNEDREWNRRDHALFVCYAPFDDPKVAVSVVVEHGGGGSKTAAPIARDIALFALSDGECPLDAYPVKDREHIAEQKEMLAKILPDLSSNKNVEI